MAGDWIKMRTDLYRDPKVCAIADILIDEDGALAGYVNQNMQRDMTVTRNVMRNVTVGALVSVWGVLRHRGKRIEDDLVIKGCTIAVIDDIADLLGFGEAMETVGWVSETSDSIVLPRFFEEFNVDPADETKKKNAERQRRYRENHKAESNDKRNVTVTSQSNAREEKRREESKPNATPSGFAEFWIAYPKKAGKGAAEKAFSKAKVNGRLPEVLKAIEEQKQSAQWQKDGGQFIPNPATWISQRRWEDEQTAPGSSSWANDLAAGAI